MGDPLIQHRLLAWGLALILVRTRILATLTGGAMIGDAAQSPWPSTSHCRTQDPAECPADCPVATTHPYAKGAQL